MLYHLTYISAYVRLSPNDRSFVLNRKESDKKETQVCPYNQIETNEGAVAVQKPKRVIENEIGKNSEIANH